MGNTTLDLMNEVKKKHANMSDYRLAQELGIGQQAISHYRKGRTRMSDVTAFKACALIGKPPTPVLIALAEERAKMPELAKIWRDVGKVVARQKGGKAA